MFRITRATMVALLAVMFWAPAAFALNPFDKSGFDLESSDIELIKQATKPFFDDETVPLGTVNEWANPETGNSGTAMLVDRFAHNDMPCRRIQHDIRMKGVADGFRYIIDRCQVADGSWKFL